MGKAETKQAEMNLLDVFEQMRTCIDCKAFHFEPGSYGYYPGEHESPSMGCAKKVWTADLYEDDQEALQRYMRTAAECEQFESNRVV